MPLFDASGPARAVMVQCPYPIIGQNEGEEEVLWICPNPPKKTSRI